MLKDLNKKNILVFVPSDDYLIRELSSVNFLSQIKKDFNVKFLFSQKLNNKIISNYDIVKKNNFLRVILWNFSQALAANIFKRNYLTKDLHYTIYQFNMNITKNKLFKFINFFTFVRLNNIFIFFSKFFLKLTAKTQNLDSCKVIILFGGHSYLDVHDLIVEANKKNIKSILVMSNWDNATKPLFIKPSLVLTWGLQTSKLAKKLNGVNAIPIGTPRFDYIKKFKKISQERAKRILNLSNKFKYIIYAGKVIPSNDYKLLNEIDKYLKKNYENFKVIYRPHPFGIYQININEFNTFKLINKWQNTIIDPTLKIFDKKDFTQYFYLFSCSDALISSFSTLTVEAINYNIPVLCFAINDLLYEKRFDYENGCKLSPHLKILNKYNWPLKAFGYDDFFLKLELLLKKINNKNYDKKVTDMIFKKIVYNDNKSYYQRVAKVINSL
jgi:CDP-glycerol glycerophosphotransferase (TagB/SpsB family)